MTRKEIDRTAAVNGKISIPWRCRHCGHQNVTHLLIGRTIPATDGWHQDDPLDRTIDEYTRIRFMEVLREERGSIKKTAKRLGVSAKCCYNWRDRWNLAGYVAECRLDH